MCFAPACSQRYAERSLCTACEPAFRRLSVDEKAARCGEVVGRARAVGSELFPDDEQKVQAILPRGNEAIELRGYAIRRLGEKDDEQTVNQLVAMYDSEQNAQVRTALMRAFGDSKQKSAVRKLMTIARSDPSVELRKAAVRYLGDSKDPEALKFLEDLLK